MPPTKKCDAPNCMNFIERGRQYCEECKPLFDRPVFVSKHEGEHMTREKRRRENNEHNRRDGK